MHLFISYARVDRPYCLQIVNMLEAAHEIWYDHRIRVGQDWWQEIQRQIIACDGFVYLISPESVSSEYCQKEYDIALTLGKHIFPVLIHPDATMPDALQKIHYADLTKGLTPQAVRDLLNAILIAERDLWAKTATAGQSSANGHNYETAVAAPAQVLPTVKPFVIDPVNLVRNVSVAMEKQDYDKAVFLLKQAKESDFKFPLINLDEMLQKAETLLEKQTYLREADRLYKPLVPMVKNPGLREFGRRSFAEFRKQFPDYDPDGLAQLCLADLIPHLEWCEVPAGEVTIEYKQKQVIFYVNAFRIAKYPITNAQFQTFVDAPDGYRDSQWWSFSPHAVKWHEENPEPAKPKFHWGDHPLARVSWYEATAFCQWFSAHVTGYSVALPSEQQWQRAAQGDKGYAYPWGNRFAKSRCNSKSSNLRKTCAVTAYPTGVGPYGTYDMAGNVWEWCESTDYQARNSSSKRSTKKDSGMPRAVRGGAFISVPQRLKSTFHFFLAPHYRYPTLGFRVVIAPDTKR